MTAFTINGPVEVFTRYLAKELRPRKITANVEAPVAVETDFGGGALRANPEAQRLVAGATTFRRSGVPDDMGDRPAYQGVRRDVPLRSETSESDGAGD